MNNKWLLCTLGLDYRFLRYWMRTPSVQYWALVAHHIQFCSAVFVYSQLAPLHLSFVLWFSLMLSSSSPQSFRFFLLVLINRKRYLLRGSPRYFPRKASRSFFDWLAPVLQSTVEYFFPPLILEIFVGDMSLTILVILAPSLGVWKQVVRWLLLCLLVFRLVLSTLVWFFIFSWFAKRIFFSFFWIFVLGIRA